MAFSYSGNPSTSPLDALRLMTGDVFEPLALLSDDEMTWLIAQYGGTANAALVPTIRAMLAKTIHDTLIRVDGIERDLTERRLALQAQLEEVLVNVTYNIATPFLGGVSIAGRDTRRQESDLIQPKFTVTDVEERA